MVMEELQDVPPLAGKGPLMIDEQRGRPYRQNPFDEVWRDAAKRASREGAEKSPERCRGFSVRFWNGTHDDTMQGGKTKIAGLSQLFTAQ